MSALSSDAQNAEIRPEDRRRHARVEFASKARFLRASGVEEPCLVINISAGGALLKAKNPPEEGESVVVYIDSVGRFEAVVVRSGKHSFAVDYKSRRAKTRRTADALTIAVNDRGRRIDRRGSPRIRQDQPAVIRLENGETIDCCILDISLTGASIEIDPRPALGTPLIVGKMAAKVVRRHDTGVGVVFTGSAAKMDEVIENARSPIETVDNGPDFAKPFGKKGAQ